MDIIIIAPQENYQASIYFRSNNHKSIEMNVPILNGYLNILYALSSLRQWYLQYKHIMSTY